MFVVQVGAYVDALDLDDIWSPGIITQIKGNEVLCELMARYSTSLAGY